MLAIIGPKWTDIRNEAGQKRLEDPDDFVRIELEAALARNVPVVPVPVGHAAMPGASQLPASLYDHSFQGELGAVFTRREMGGLPIGCVGKV